MNHGVESFFVERGRASRRVAVYRRRRWRSRRTRAAPRPSPCRPFQREVRQLLTELALRLRGPRAVRAAHLTRRRCAAPTWSRATWDRSTAAPRPCRRQGASQARTMKDLRATPRCDPNLHGPGMSEADLLLRDRSRASPTSPVVQSRGSHHRALPRPPSTPRREIEKGVEGRVMVQALIDTAGQRGGRATARQHRDRALRALGRRGRAAVPLPPLPRRNGSRSEVYADLPLLRSGSTSRRHAPAPWVWPRAATGAADRAANRRHAADCRRAGARTGVRGGGPADLREPWMAEQVEDERGVAGMASDRRRAGGRTGSAREAPQTCGSHGWRSRSRMSESVARMASDRRRAGGEPGPRRRPADLQEPWMAGAGPRMSKSVARMATPSATPMVLPPARRWIMLPGPEQAPR